MSRLVFNEARHTYSLDGHWVPGASTVARSTSRSSDPLIRWGAGAAASWALIHRDEVTQMGEAEWVAAATNEHVRRRDTSMREGKQLHSIAERLIAGEPVALEDPDTGEEYPDDVVAMGEQVARFLDAWKIDPGSSLVECAIFNEDHHYAGRFDLAAWLRSDEWWLIDYKTGATGVWPDTALQLTGYSRATHVVIDGRDMVARPVNRCAALWVRPDSWELVPVKSDAGAWDCFLHALAVYRWTGQRRDDVIGAALPVPDEVAS